MGAVTDEDGYLLDNQQAAAGERLDALSALFNPWTFRHLEALRLAPGWRVWEVGAGSPSVPGWIADQVRPGGHVLATDIDTRWLDGTPLVEVRRHDVGSDPPPSGPFDLTHARLLLTHVPDRTRALASMVAALRPGGWLVLEEADPTLQPLVCLEEVGPAQRLANTLKRGFRSLLAQRGVDLSLGRKLPRLLREAGLVEVAADAFFPITGPGCVELERATIKQLRERFVTFGIATDTQIDEHVANVAGGKLDLATSPLVSAWGRRPW
ncbi:MAG: methyltransferase domain-containing protein [Carbonactinosporaceae bacterium]